MANRSTSPAVVPVTEPRVEHPQSLTPWGWIRMLIKVTSITISLLFTALNGAQISENDSSPTHTLTYHQRLGYTALRKYQGGLNALEIQALLPSTSTSCRGFAKRHRLRYSEIRLPDGTIASWIGPPHSASKKVVVLFHGGGYTTPILNEHIDLAFGFSKPPSRLKDDVSVVVLEYGLASETTNHYPTQLHQATLLIQHLLTVTQIPASDITLLGDSAGAHLLLSLLIHLVHPNPKLVIPAASATEEIKSQSASQIAATATHPPRFAAAVLISPWLSLTPTTTKTKTTTTTTSPPSSSTSRNNINSLDILTTASLTYWSDNFLHGAEEDAWNAPLSTPEEWLADLSAVVGEVLVLYGEDEVLADTTRRFCGRLETSVSSSTSSNANNTTTNNNQNPIPNKIPLKITTQSFPHECHCHMLMNRFLHINAPCESERVFVQWFERHIATRDP